MVEDKEKEAFSRLSSALEGIQAFGNVAVSMALIVSMVPQLLTCLQTHQAVYIKHLKSFVCQVCPNEAVCF